MALSMDEQRMLAEIERRLAAEDPGLETKLSSFRRPRPAAGLRTARGKIIGSLCTIVLLAVIGATVYAMIAVRAHTLKAPPTRTQSASSQATSSSAQADPAPTTAPHIIGINNVPSHNG
jgi:Protein of unknown function (DUF3040)